MKICKKVLALLLVAGMMLGVMPAAVAVETTAAPVTTAAPAQELSLEQQVLIAYAKAMLARGARAQYDDTQMVPGELGGTSTTGYRWQVETRVAESYTSQLDGYTNCAAFTHDVYYFGLGMDIGYWSTAQLIKADEAVRPFYYKVTGKETAEEKAAMEARFMATLQPADILVYRHSGSSAGHALFHAGNGYIIHSTATSSTHSYSYLAQQERREPNGTIMEMDVSRFFRDESYSRYFFGGTVNEIAIVRPLNIWKGTVPQMSIDRMNNLSGVMAEKLASHTVGQTILPGEELTYTIRMENRNETPVTLAVTDELSRYVTLVSGCKDAKEGKLSWSVTIEGGKTAEVAYTVKVNADVPEGTALLADKATVGNVVFPCPATYVGKHFTDEQKQAVNKAAQVMDDKSGVELAQHVFGDLDVDLSVLEDLPVVLDSLFVPSEERPDHYVLNETSPYFAAVAPSMYGGTLVEHSQLFGTARTRTPYLNQLEVGDIAIATYAPFSTEYVMYLVTGEDAVLRLDQPQLFTGEDAQKTMDTLLSYHKFAVLRPAALPEKDMVAGLTAAATSIVPDVAEVTGKGETVTLFQSDFERYEVGEDALWATILAGEEFASNVTEKDDATVRYDIVQEDGNKALQFFSAKKKAPWMKVNQELVGNFSVQLDFKMPDKPKHNQYLYMTLYQDSQTHAFIHLHSEGVRFQYKPLKTDQTSNNLNVPPYMLFSEHVTPEEWHTIKIARIDGALFLKIWDKGQPEPEQWMMALHNTVLDASQPSYFRMQYYVTGVSNSMKSADIYSDMMVDNLIVTRQVELPEADSADVAATRGEMITGLWNMMGSPEVKNVTNPFVDVKESDECYEAVLWAYANGITAGTSATTFSPDTPVKRGQMATFLYRAVKAEVSTATNPFVDVPADAYFCAPALWAAENGVMVGVDKRTFAPAEDCTCGQVEAAIKRAFAEN